MSNTAVIYARIDKDLKESAEKILSEQTVIAIGGMNQEQITKEVLNGLESLNDGYLSVEEVDKI